MKPEIVIRQAKSEDLEEILRLLKSLNEDGEDLTLEEGLEILKVMESYPYHKVFVVEKEGKIVATFTLTIIDYLAHKGKRVGILEDVVVEEKERSKGLGTRIIEFAISECKRKNCYKLALSSNKKREKAHEFYMKRGFSLHGYSFSIQVSHEEEDGSCFTMRE